MKRREEEDEREGGDDKIARAPPRRCPCSFPPRLGAEASGSGRNARAPDVFPSITRLLDRRDQGDACSLAEDPGRVTLMKMGMPTLKTPEMVCNVCGRIEIPSVYCTNCFANDWGPVPPGKGRGRSHVRRGKRARPPR
jgi:hypothetical protein